MSEDKQAIRARALKFRNDIDVHPDFADKAMQNFFDVMKPSSSQKIALYFPIDKELDTLSLAEHLWNLNIICLLPVFDKSQTVMKFARWDKSTKLVPSAFHVPMPENPVFDVPDIVVVPLVAFDQKGNRLGFGKGYYDATLRVLRSEKTIVAVGYAYAEQAVLMKLPTEEHDEKLDLVITPQRVFDFRSF